MAFNQTPQYDTYQQETIPLMKELNNRDASANKDSDYINLFFEVVKNKVTQENDYIVIKRPGSTTLAAAIGTGEVRGSFYWDYNGCIYYAVGQGLYKYEVATNTQTTVNATYFSTSTGEVAFTEFLYEPVGAYGAIVLMISDGTTLTQIDSTGTVTTCADADLPAHLPQLVFLDGYLFLVKVNTAEIYNSDLNNPLSWTPGNFITAEFAADNLLRLAKLNNYIVAFGTHSIEYFWDAANASGSPLQVNPTPIKLNGFLGGFAQITNKIYFLGNNEMSEPSVFFLEDFKINTVENAIIRKYLASLSTNLATNAKGVIMSGLGHDFYIINVSSQTYVIELDTNLPTKWAWKSTTSFPITTCLSIKSSIGFKCVFSITGSTKLYNFTPSAYQDDGEPFTWTLITDNQEFKSYNRKAMGRLIIWADKPSGSLPVDVSWTDDDYQTYSTPISVDLYQELPCLNRLGMFRRRAFKLSSSANQPLRMYMLECNINKGNR